MAGSERAIEGFFTAVIAPDATVFEPQQHLEKTSKVNLERMTEQELYSYICGTLLDAENKKYSRGNTGYHKLIFLAGGDENDIAACHDLEGNPIYTKLPDYIKYPEITEFNAAVLNYNEFPRKERESKKEAFEVLKVKVMSEIADVFHNLITLTILDHERERTYSKCINRLASTLGYSIHDCLLLSASKYKKRLIDIGKKDIDEEENTIKNIITPDASGKTLISFPIDKCIGVTAGAINEIGNIIIKARIKELTLLHKWNGSAQSQLHLQNI